MTDFNFIEIEDILTVQGPGFLYEIKEPWEIDVIKSTIQELDNNDIARVKETGTKCMIITQSPNPIIHKAIMAFVEGLLTK